MIISGAYGRDYKSMKAVMADWNAGKDFIIRDLFSGGGTYVNKQDAAGMHNIEVRYDRDTKVGVIK